MIGLTSSLITKANANLFSGIGVLTKDSPYVLKTASADGYIILMEYPAQVQNGKTYTFQVKTDGIISDSSIGKYNTHQDVMLYIIEGGYLYNIKLPLKKQTNVLGSGAHIFTFEWTHPDTTVYPRVGTFSDGSTVNTIKFWDFKLEEGSIPTDIEIYGG